MFEVIFALAGCSIRARVPITPIINQNTSWIQVTAYDQTSKTFLSKLIALLISA